MQKMHRSAQKGFTLIELMIVVAIIAMLATLAVPQYQNYVARTQFAEAMTLFAGLRSGIEAQLQIHGGDVHEPDHLIEGHRQTGRYVETTEIAHQGDGLALTLRFGGDDIRPELDGEAVTFERHPGGGGSDGTWSCEPAAAIAGYATGLCAKE